VITAAAHQAVHSNLDGWLVLAAIGVLLVLWLAGKLRG
jgi:hypothetical protein